MELDFSKLDGLVTAVIQDATSGRVLMVGFMNEESWKKTVESGFATFYSRSRKKLWLKGESSGHRLVVKEAPLFPTAERFVEPALIASRCAGGSPTRYRSPRGQPPGCPCCSKRHTRE